MAANWSLRAVLVKAAKLEHEREYQRMLRDIADLAAEAVLQGFAPASTSTAISPSRAPRLLYQQFAILQARLADDELSTQSRRWFTGRSENGCARPNGGRRDGR